MSEEIDRLVVAFEADYRDLTKGLEQISSEIKQSANELGEYEENINALGDTFEGVSGPIKDATDEVSDLNSSIQDTSRYSDNARSSVDELGNSIDDTGNRADGVTDSMEIYAEKVEDISSSANDAKSDVDDINDAIKETDSSSKGASDSMGDLITDLVGIPANAAAAVGAIGALVAVLLDAHDAYSTLEADIAYYTGSTSKYEVAPYMGVVERLQATSSVYDRDSIKTVVGALGHYYPDASMDELAEMGKAYMDYSTATGNEVGALVESVNNIAKDYDLSSDEQIKFLGQLTTVFQKYKLQPRDVEEIPKLLSEKQRVYNWYGFDSLESRMAFAGSVYEELGSTKAKQFLDGGLEQAMKTALDKGMSADVVWSRFMSLGGANSESALDLFGDINRAESAARVAENIDLRNIRNSRLVAADNSMNVRMRETPLSAITAFGSDVTYHASKSLASPEEMNGSDLLLAVLTNGLSMTPSYKGVMGALGSLFQNGAKIETDKEVSVQAESIKVVGNDGQFGNVYNVQMTNNFNGMEMTPLETIRDVESNNQKAVRSA